VRDRLIESWNDTNQHFEAHHVKRVAYLSLEFLMGRSLQNSLLNMDLEDSYRQALKEMGYDLEKLYDREPDAALGNGGLGRLAACFLDSMATLDLPAWGYGIRYTYGIFRQLIKNGAQVRARVRRLPRLLGRWGARQVAAAWVPYGLSRTVAVTPCTLTPCPRPRPLPRRWRRPTTG
jgi:glucan phosphorylase